MNNIKINSIQMLLIKVILIVSCPFLTLLLSNTNETNIMYILIGVSLSFGVAGLIIRKSRMDNEISLKKLLLYLLISCHFIGSVSIYSTQSMLMIQEMLKNTFSFNADLNTITRFVSIMSLPIVVFFVKWFFDNVVSKIVYFFKNMTKTEKMFLYVITIVASIFSILIIYKTNAFSRPTYGNFIIDYDVIYTSDTGELLKNDVYTNVSFIENDIRQPLFGVFSLPFSVLARFISQFCFFCKSGYEYETVMTIIQYVLLSISIILLARLLKVKENKKPFFYIFFAFSFSYFFFSLLLEQYVISLFYLILAIYYYFENSQKTNYLYVGAVGTLITSGIIFPLITKYKSIKQWLISTFKCFALFAGTFIISGQIPQIFFTKNRFNFLFNSFAGKVTFIQKVYQYTAFIKGLFLPNSGTTIWKNNIPRYQLCEYNSIEWIGVAVLVLCVISFILNRKNKMAWISMAWITFSIIILVFIGWGTYENGLVLYSLYFSWAFLILIYLLIDKIFKNRIVFYTLITSLCIFMVVENILEFINIFKFAIKYY